MSSWFVWFADFILLASRVVGGCSTADTRYGRALPLWHPAHAAVTAQRCLTCSVRCIPYCCQHAVSPGPHMPAHRRPLSRQRAGRSKASYNRAPPSVSQCSSLYWPILFNIRWIKEDHAWPDVTISRNVNLWTKVWPTHHSETNTGN